MIYSGIIMTTYQTEQDADGLQFNFLPMGD